MLSRSSSGMASRRIHLIPSSSFWWWLFGVLYSPFPVLVRILTLLIRLGTCPWLLCSFLALTFTVRVRLTQGLGFVIVGHEKWRMVPTLLLIWISPVSWPLDAVEEIYKGLPLFDFRLSFSSFSTGWSLSSFHFHSSYYLSTIFNVWLDEITSRTKNTNDDLQEVLCCYATFSLPLLAVNSGA